MKDSTVKRASIIVVNWNGRELLEECISSLIQAITYDGLRHEIIVIDNGSRDGSAEFVKSRFPAVRLIPLKENKRFAGANNIAASASENDILIFINNDVVVDREFLAPLLRHFSEKDIFAVTPRIIMEPRWVNGVRIEETGLTRGGFENGFLHLWQDHPATNNPLPILYASGSAMACSKEKFLALDGFDTLFNPFYYEDTDLSYRALKRGWRIIYEPASIVYHKYRATNNPKNFNISLLERAYGKNDILFIWKNITDSNFLIQHILHLSKRLLKSFVIFDADYMLSFLWALGQLPQVIMRRLIQPRRDIISDRRILEKIFTLPEEKKIKNTGKNKYKKILVFGSAPLPFENQHKIYAITIRTWNLTKPLLEDGHKIHLVSMRVENAYFNHQKLPSVIESRKDGFTYFAAHEHLFYNHNFMQRIHDEFQPDCIVGVNTYPSARAAVIKTDRPFWADIFGSPMAEAQTKAYLEDDDTCLNDYWMCEKAALKKADIFSAVSLPHKLALIGKLGALGRLNKFTFGYEFVHYMPIGIDDIEYQHQKRVIRERCVGNDDFVILWSGSYNTWADVETLFLALEAAMKKNPKIKFVSIGGPVIGHDEKTYYKFLNRIYSSSFSDRFIFNEWVPTEDVPNYYFESDIGINCDSLCYETMLGARNRITEMLKAGLPVLTSLGTEISQIVQKERIGFTFPIGDVKSLSDTILFLADNRDLIKEYGRRGKEYVFRNLTFDKTAAPLKEWAKNPKPAPDKGKKEIILYEELPRNRLKKYLAFALSEGFGSANKRALTFLNRKKKEYFSKNQ